MPRPSHNKSASATSSSTVDAAATVVAVCISTHKGEAKHGVVSAECRAGHGLVGDAHAGPGPRQVSIMARADVLQFAAGRLELAPGAFGENLLLDDMDVSTVRCGDRLVIEHGPVLEITAIGKECHNHACAIRRAMGDCIMPRKGVFARVIRSGTITAGQAVRHLPQPFA